jgi:D-alanine-D-alanine ligase
MKRVAVLRGGPSEEYAVSMRSGAAVLEALDALHYPYKDIVITKDGEWLETGIARSPEHILEAVDVAFIALHGQYGEDGQVQKILHRKHIPFTGSRSLPSAIAFNKELTKFSLQSHNILMPKHRKFTLADIDTIDDEVETLFREVGEELFIKPLRTGSSHGARYAPNKEILTSSLRELLTQYDELLVEEFIRGREATVGVLHDFRNQAVYTLPPIEIVPPNGEPAFTYEHKYSGKTEEIVPGRFSYDEKERLGHIASQIHHVLHLDHYSRSDFIVRNGDIYFLEVNTLPGLTTESLLPKAAAAVGLSYRDLIAHLVETARV